MTRTTAQPSDAVLSANTVLARTFGTENVLVPFVDWLSGSSELTRLWRSAIAECSSGKIFDALLGALNIGVQCSPADLERIPATGPLVIVANHPHGLLDGLVIGSVLLRRRRDVRFMANSVLSSIPGLDEFVIPVDVFSGSGAVNRKAARDGMRWLRSGGVLVTFPAGQVSAPVGMPPVIADAVWSAGPMRIAAATGARIVQAFISGRNSVAFQFAGFAHPMLRTLLLGRELLNKRGGDIEIAFGNPLPADVNERPLTSEYLRRRTWVLGRRTALKRRRALYSNAALAAPIDSSIVQRNIEQLSPECLVFQSGSWSAYVATAKELPDILEEIGRLRELTFRQAGEGTGKRCDLDRFDYHYQHLFIWNAETREIAGAYRLGAVDDIIGRFGVKGLYTHTLFSYQSDFIERLTPGLELGRSFVRPEYQRRPHSLFYLWRGIGAVLARTRRFRYLFGPVSISNDYSTTARELMARYFRAHARTSEWHVRARHPFRPGLSNDLADLNPWLSNLDDLGDLISDLEPDGKRLPVLLRQYLRIGAEIIEFNVDPAFSNALDALIVVDLTQCEPRTLAKYMGSEAALQYLDGMTAPASSR